ncbi:MAG: fasciclin domain-containing protein, partial [Acidimicrobiia bacterium]|nr:fasciclin domain-containing protein [Acidimicrobiia bacterium]
GFAGPPSDSDIVETVIALSGPSGFDDNTGDFDILRTAVVATEAEFGTATLLSGDDNYTVFAPNDAAFIATAMALGVDLSGLSGADKEAAVVDALVATFGVDGIFGILAYHVTDGVRPSPSVVNAKQITMLANGTIAYDANLGKLVANNSSAGLVATDIRVDNGMIHVIDFVLVP